MSKSRRWDSKDSESKRLPIHHHKAKLIQAVKESNFLVVTGETGSGKTTQLPQFLHQAGTLLFRRPVHSGVIFLFFIFFKIRYKLNR